jgi:hypothetical protein
MVGDALWIAKPPAPLQCFMNEAPLGSMYCFFFYDVLICSSTWLSHLEHLETVLQTIKQHVLFV